MPFAIESPGGLYAFLLSFDYRHAMQWPKYPSPQMMRPLGEIYRYLVSSHPELLNVGALDGQLRHAQKERQLRDDYERRLQLLDDAFNEARKKKEAVRIAEEARRIEADNILRQLEYEAEEQQGELADNLRTLLVLGMKDLANIAPFTEVIAKNKKWFVPREGMVTPGRLVYLLSKEDIPHNLTRKSLDKANKKLKKVIIARYCTDRPGPQPAYPAVGRWVQLLSQQDFKRAGEQLKNCLWLEYWCGGEPVNAYLVYYNPKLKLALAFDRENMSIEDVAGVNNSKDFTPAQSTAIEALKNDIQLMIDSGEIKPLTAEERVALEDHSYSQENPAKDKRLGSLPRRFRGEDVYDPREESIRAVARGVGNGWGIAVGKYMKSHTPGEIVQRSWERYQQPDALIRKRQEYEGMLGRGRRYGAYRITQEPTTAGLRYFIWPLPPGQRLPKPYRSRRMAESALRRINATPTASLPRKAYTKSELKQWLPPEDVFAGRSQELTASGKKELTMTKKKKTRRNPMGNVPSSISTGFLPVARYVRPSFASQPGPTDPNIKPYSQLIDPQLWRLADGGDHVAMYELERRGLSHMRPARPNPDNLDHLRPDVRKRIFYIAKIKVEEGFPNDAKHPEMRKDIDTAMRMIRNGTAKFNPRGRIPKDVHTYFAMRNPTDGPQARGMTFMHSEMNEEWANWALARQGIQHRGQGYGPGSFPVGARLNPKYRFSAEKKGKGYVVTVHGPDGDPVAKYRFFKDNTRGMEAAIEKVKATFKAEAKHQARKAKMREARRKAKKSIHRRGWL